ncbi:MAG: hypothetical protein EOO39_49420 [Cytophagaceae bacterium]|nr:MAG: hypothetical protein EOO39_49420 [Cytophagaceae bacterium]
MTITAAGYVGIGSTSPGQKLTVAGTIESTSGGVKFPDGTTQTTAASAGSLPDNYLTGAITLNSASDLNFSIDIQPGSAKSSSNNADIKLTTTLTKSINAPWSAGTGQGGRDTGAFSAGSWHVYLIKNTSTNVVDATFSLSPTSPALPSGFTEFRRIASLMTTGSGFRAYIQNGDDFIFKASAQDYYISGASLGTNFLAYVGVPTGIKLKVTVQGYSQYLGSLDISSGDADGHDPSSSNNVIGSPGTNAFTGSIGGVWTNTSGQIRVRSYGSQSAGAMLSFATKSYSDLRGK